MANAKTSMKIKNFCKQVAEEICSDEQFLKPEKIVIDIGKFVKENDNEEVLDTEELKKLENCSIETASRLRTSIIQRFNELVGMKTDEFIKISDLSQKFFTLHEKKHGRKPDVEPEDFSNYLTGHIERLTQLKNELVNEVELKKIEADVLREQLKMDHKHESRKNLLK